MSDATLDRKLLPYKGSRRTHIYLINDVAWPTDEEEVANQGYEPTYYGDNIISEKITDRIDASPQRTYSKCILITFAISIVVIAVGVMALVVSPLYATRDMITVIFFVCAAGVALLSFVLKQVEGI
jgi:hypothetical protein